MLSTLYSSYYSWQVMDMYYPNNMKKEEFDKFLEETGYDEKSE